MYHEIDGESEAIVEQWFRDFYYTMDGDFRVGDRSGDEPGGVKIIFDGYGEDCETGEEDRNSISFAMFIHKDSFDHEFPEHDFTPWALIHRPKEEYCIWAWYEVDEDCMRVNTEDINNEETPFDLNEMIHKLWIRDETGIG